VSAELQRAAQRLAEDDRVLAVWAFGSQASGTAGPSSDVDLAVLLDVRALGLADELRLRARAVEALRRDDIDLVVLNQAPPLLRYEVLAGGTLLFCRNQEAVQDFEERALREFLDTAHLRATQEALARQR
jgi:predicted nucleotidyltransferase